MTRHGERGFSLVELIIAITVLALISMLIYGAFAGMRNSKEGVGRVGDRVHEGREAMRRIARELSSAFISTHAPLSAALAVQTTAFRGTQGTPADRLDFASFAHRRLDRDSHESDQCEISYFGAPDPKDPGITDLVRRVSPLLDLVPEKGGRVDVLASDIDLFRVEYLDPQTGDWVDTWDTTNTIGQPGRLPVYAHVLLVLNGGKRPGAGRSSAPIRFETKVALPIHRALSFATE
ncbi:MAG: prepilin-type N-terminal cleavage/methylation domain-containing protein [Deltaproteobacteria bacterium]|nr:prepilin-type N-terminal cleavage/methylation domain-containing protein [Deltaproteobacteria bacterium]